MDEIEMEENVVDIDIIDPIDNGDPIIAYDETERTEGEFSDSITVSGSAIGTGNLVGQIFKLIASFREKTYWELDNKEIKSLNTTCPKIIPKILSEHSGIISCVLSLLGIIMKRLKLEQKDNLNYKEPELEDKIDISADASTGLTGGRTS